MENKMIRKKCLKCGEMFDARAYRVKKGWAKYCSKLCYSETRDRELALRGVNTRYKKGHIASEKAVRNRIISNTGSNNKLWKGDNVSYRGLHNWVRRHLGVPTKCSICGNTERKIDWSNIDHEYRRDLKDYKAMCRVCHKFYDMFLFKAVALKASSFRRGPVVVC